MDLKVLLIVLGCFVICAIILIIMFANGKKKKQVVTKPVEKIPKPVEKTLEEISHSYLQKGVILKHGVFEYKISHFTKNKFIIARKVKNGQLFTFTLDEINEYSIPTYCHEFKIKD